MQGKGGACCAEWRGSASSFRHRSLYTHVPQQPVGREAAEEYDGAERGVPRGNCLMGRGRWGGVVALGEVDWGDKLGMGPTGGDGKGDEWGKGGQ